ncbi:MAG: hypothetical protein WC933_02570 [Candidatus Paceibacterota bacterium]
MKRYTKIIVMSLVLIIIGTFIYINKDNIVNKITTAENIKGCYVAHLANDVYSLKVSTQDGENVEGTLVIKNAEKDSSSGPIKGTYKNGILYADYTFLSEGTTSVGDVIFKKVGDGFLRGYGNTEGGVRLIDIPNVIYDSSYVYEATSSCITSL